MEEAGKLIAEYATLIVKTPQNYPIMIVSWFAVELTDRILAWFIASPRLTKVARVRWLSLLQIGKFGAAAFWCALLVWVPHAQPELCTGDDLPTCQTVVERFATAIVLGAFLSSGHFAIARASRRLLGGAKKRRVVCANCRKPSEISDLNDPCQNCGQPPHEVTSRS